MLSSPSVGSRQSVSSRNSNPITVLNSLQRPYCYFTQVYVRYTATGTLQKSYAYRTTLCFVSSVCSVTNESITILELIPFRTPPTTLT